MEPVRRSIRRQVSPQAGPIPLLLTGGEDPCRAHHPSELPVLLLHAVAHLNQPHPQPHSRGPFLLVEDYNITTSVSCRYVRSGHITMFYCTALTSTGLISCLSFLCYFKCCDACCVYEGEKQKKKNSTARRINLLKISILVALDIGYIRLV